MSEKDSITVSGITFTAEQVKKVTIEVGGREITIGEEKKEKKVGFK